MPGDGRANLKPFNQLTEEEQRKIASNGGKASVKKRREKKAAKDLLEMLVSMKIQDPKIIAKFEKMGLKTKGMTNDMLLTYALFQQALKGDVKAIKYADERLGRNPALELRKREVDIKDREAQTEVTTIELIADVLAEVRRQADEINSQAGGVHTESDA